VPQGVENRRFLCCPGIEFNGRRGNRWAFWGEKVVFPRTFEDKRKTIQYGWAARAGIRQ